MSPRARRILLGSLGLVVGLPLAFVAFATYHLRHVPYAIAARDRAPAFDPAAAGGLTVRFLGCTGYEVSDGKTTILLDPTPTRPTPLELLRPIRPDEALGARVCPKADYILVNHAHHDHALDVPAIARRTGAMVVGSRSACNLARSRGVERVHEARPGERLELGTFTVEVRASRHTDLFGSPNHMTGTIPPDAGELYFWQYTQDATLCYRLESGGSSIWFHPTSTYAPGELGGRPAGTLIVGVTGEPVTEEKLRGLLSECRPERVLPTHYDNFFQPLDRGLALLPEADLEKARALVAAIAPAATWWVLDYGERVRSPADAAPAR
jgi:L-ascorbate metabolism protein UlaG (beta-lactamase superfamily)